MNAQVTTVTKRSTSKGTSYSLLQGIPRDPKAPPGPSKFKHTPGRAKNASKRAFRRVKVVRLKSRGVERPYSTQGARFAERQTQAAAVRRFKAARGIVTNPVRPRTLKRLEAKSKTKELRKAQAELKRLQGAA